MAVFTTFFLLPQYYPLNLPAGNPIGPGGPFHTFGFSDGRLAHFVRTSSFYRTGGFFRDSTGFLGVEFVSHGKTHYGWIEMEIDSIVKSVIVKGYAYEATPNQYIIAGAGMTTGVAEHNQSISPASSFYPNPARNGKSFIEVVSKQFSDLKLEVMNGMGQILQTEDHKLNSGKNVVELNVGSLASGTYFVKLSQGDQINFRKIVVSN